MALIRIQILMTAGVMNLAYQSQCSVIIEHLGHTQHCALRVRDIEVPSKRRQPSLGMPTAGYAPCGHFNLVHDSHQYSVHTDVALLMVYLQGQFTGKSLTATLQLNFAILPKLVLPAPLVTIDWRSPSKGRVKITGNHQRMHFQKICPTVFSNETTWKVCELPKCLSWTLFSGNGISSGDLLTNHWHNS